MDRQENDFAPKFQPRPVAWTPEKVGRHWDYFASQPAYDAHYFSRHSGKHILAFIAAHADLRGRRILDFGCGPGFLLERMLDAGLTAGGLEFSARSVEEATRRNLGKTGFLGVTRATGLPSGLAAGSHDAVISVEVVEHLFDDQLAGMLRETHRVLVPGGLAIITTPNDERLESETVQCPDCGGRFHRWQHMRRFDAPGLERLMTDAGFTTIVCTGTRFGGRRGLKKATAAVRNSLRRLRGRTIAAEAQPHLIYIGRRG